MLTYEFWGFKWNLVVVYIYSYIMLGCGSYKKLVHTKYIQYHLHYNADKVLCMVASLQLLALVFAYLVVNIILCYF